MHRVLVFSLFAVTATGVFTWAAGAGTTAPSTAKADPFPGTVQPFLKKNCLLCHNDQAKMGGLTLAPYHSTPDMIQSRDLWERVSTRIKNGEMPPKGIPRPPASDVSMVTGAIDHVFEEIDRNTPPDPGHLTAHRLNKFEYNNAVKDLFDIDFRPADDFPADDSGYGFDNIGDVLSVSPVLMEKYLSAAEKVAKKVISTGAAPKATRERVASTSHHKKYSAAPIGEYVHYNILNEAEYSVRAGVSGRREPLRITLLVDNQPVKEADFDSHDDEAPRYVEFPTHLTAGEHRLGARLVRIHAIEPLPTAPDLRLVNLDRSKPVGQAPSTPWVEYIEVRGPFKPLPQPPTEAQKKLTICAEQDGACAAKILAFLAYRAWRRPVTTVEAAKLADFVAMAQAQGDSFDQGLQLGIEAVLVSPAFLFRLEDDNGRGSTAHTVSDFELASRLSFFLWSSIPDAELLRAAGTNTLHQPAVLRAQLTRMLKDPKSERLVNNFAGQWLELRNLDSISPDPDKFPQFGELRNDMRTETKMFFEAVIREDRSLLDFLDGRFTFLNEDLAKFYGIPGVAGDQFRRVSLDGTERSGVLTQASVLTVSSYPTRTSPVIRGKWVLENFLNAPPPPPPPNVPALNDAGIGTKMSMRQQLEEHRKNPVCASCHSKMDPLGFGLENYNAIGQWRTVDGRFPIDSSGTLPSGKSFTTPQQLKAILKSDPNAFAQCVVEKMLTYALGRGLERYDRPAVKKIVDNLAANGYRFSVLISGIVESMPFQMGRSEGERHVTQTLAKTSNP